MRGIIHRNQAGVRISIVFRCYKVIPGRKVGDLLLEFLGRGSKRDAADIDVVGAYRLKNFPSSAIIKPSVTFRREMYERNVE